MQNVKLLSTITELSSLLRSIMVVCEAEAVGMCSRERLLGHHRYAHLNDVFQGIDVISLCLDEFTHDEQQCPENINKT